MPSRHQLKPRQPARRLPFERLPGLVSVKVPVVAWKHCEDGCNVSGGGRLVAACAALGCGAATLILALALAPDAPLLVLLVVVVAAAAGVALALHGSRDGAPAGSAPAEVAPVDPVAAAAAVRAQADGLTFSIPLAPIGESLEPPAEPSQPFEALARTVRELAPPAGLIQVTSPMVGEGKTTVATNLAAALSAVGDRVLLVDADLDRLRAHLMLGTAPQRVSNGRPLREYVVPTHSRISISSARPIPRPTGGSPSPRSGATSPHQYDLTLIDTGGGVAREHPEPFSTPISTSSSRAPITRRPSSSRSRASGSTRTRRSSS